MPSATLTCTGTAANTLRLSGGATLHACIATQDADTTYAHCNVSEDRNGTCTNSQMPADAALVSAATNYGFFKCDGPGGDVYAYVHIGTGWSSAIASNETNYTYRSQAHSSGRLTVAYMNSDPVGVRCDSNGARGLRCTYAYRTVTYTQSGGEFYLIPSLVWPVMFGASMLFREFTTALDMAAAFIPGRTSVRYTPQETIQLWKSYQEYKFPAYC
jgi:hypothetical protein